MSKKFRDIVEAVNQREPEIKKFTDAQLQSKTPEFRRQLDAGTSLDDLLPEAFAVVREAAVRTLKQRHYDVQIMGGVALHQGSIAEMRTGEGKTLTSTLAVYLNALTGKGCTISPPSMTISHAVTRNGWERFITFSDSRLV